MTLPTFKLSLIDLVVIRARQRVAQGIAEAKAALEPPTPPVDLSNVPHKKCRGKCEELLPATLEFFYKHKTGRDGLDWRCKKCKLAYDQKRRAKSRNGKKGKWGK